MSGSVGARRHRSHSTGSYASLKSLTELSSFDGDGLHCLNGGSELNVDLISAGPGAAPGADAQSTDQLFDMAAGLM